MNYVFVASGMFRSQVLNWEHSSGSACMHVMLAPAGEHGRQLQCAPV
jgi:hypothetical protein